MVKDPGWVNLSEHTWVNFGKRYRTAATWVVEVELEAHDATLRQHLLARIVPTWYKSDAPSVDDWIAGLDAGPTKNYFEKIVGMIGS